MHIHQAGFPLSGASAAMITVCVFAIGFMVWVLVGLTMEKSKRHAHCRLEYRINNTLPSLTSREPIHELSPQALPAEPNYKRWKFVLVDET